MDTTGIDRSGRNMKCPNCGANNKVDAEWCWQCLDRFPPPATEPAPEAGAAPEKDALLGRAQLRREAADELAGIAEAEAVEELGKILVDQGSGPGSESPSSEQTGPVTGATAANGNGGKPAAPDAVIAGQKGEIAVTGEKITWTCSLCETVNEFSRNTCEVCGASFAEVLREPETDRKTRDPNTTALISLFFAGAGHAYLGMWGQAVARGVISLWVAVTAVFASLQGSGPATIMGITFGLVAFGLWVVSAHDAYREAAGQQKMVLLRDRMFLYLVLTLLMLSIAMVFALASGAR